MRRLALGGHSQRDQDFAIGIELIFVGHERGERAFDLVELITFMMEKMQTDTLQFHPRAVFFLLEISGPDLDDFSAFLVALDMVPIRGLAGDIHREHIRPGRSLFFDLAPLGSVGEAEPAEDRKNSQ